MSVHPIFAHMFENMARVGLVPESDGLRQIPVNDATKPSDAEVQQVRHALDLRAARLKREAKERERRHAQRQGFGFTPDGDAA